MDQPRWPILCRGYICLHGVSGALYALQASDFYGQIAQQHPGISQARMASRARTHPP